MGLKNLPLLAKFYWGFVCLLGPASVIALTWIKVPFQTGALLELCSFLLVAAVAGGKKVKLVKTSGDSETVSMSLGFVITFAAMLRFGPVGALTGAAISGISGCTYPKRQPLFQILFNVSLSMVEAFLGSLVYLTLNNWSTKMVPSHMIGAAGCSVLTYFICNTGGVAIMIAICSKQNVFRLWKDTFLWTVPSYIAGGSVSALAMVLLGNNSAFMLLLVTPVFYVINQTYTATTARVEEKLKHAEEMQANQSRLAELYLATIKSLALAIDAKDQYTHQHILRVQKYSVALAIQMGLEGSELEAVNTGALLHDIGKLGVPEYVLLKPGKLTDEEYDKIKKHPEIGASILDPVEFPWPVLPVVKYHHEKWDGSGYPEGLKGEEIPLTARIMAVADVYDALTSSRSYRGAWTHEKALQTIIDGAGSHFDANCVEAFKIAIVPVIEEMAREGTGPLTSSVDTSGETSKKVAEVANEIGKTSTEYWAMHEVTESLKSSNDVDEAVAKIQAKLEAIFEGATCEFMIEATADFREDGLHISHGAEDDTLVAPGSHAYDVLTTGDTYMGPLTEPDGKQKSALIVRLASETVVWGNVSLTHDEPDYFVERDAHLIECIAIHLSTSLAQSNQADANGLAA